MNDRQVALPFDCLEEPVPEAVSPRGSAGNAAGPTETASLVEHRESGEAVTAAALQPGLDTTMVGVVVLREVDRALSLYPDWVHPFAGLSFNRARRSYGQAHRDGRIVISQVFLGTDALEDLEDTVRHEIAHLVVGIDQRHGPAWRKVAKSLGAEPRARGRAVSPELAARMDAAPYTLIAVLESGEERELKTVFRRSRTYLNYRYRWGGRRYEVEGQTVIRFRYDEKTGP